MGWEGVGLCSYLLIGFWYTDPNNGYCARKAFVMTRVGDAFYGYWPVFLLFVSTGTLNIQESYGKWLKSEWIVGSWCGNEQ